MNFLRWIKSLVVGGFHLEVRSLAFANTLSKVINLVNHRLSRIQRQNVNRKIILAVKPVRLATKTACQNRLAQRSRKPFAKLKSVQEGVLLLRSGEVVESTELPESPALDVAVHTFRRSERERVRLGMKRIVRVN